ncbi:50S ribosomal protein L6 [Candidatus Pacearchaeota archaeon CG1_02_32_132]|nr:MAG: 50S ribosomal protein L6 [Candidatus Pacearchaeota archaeon CG1_02_32_132]
MKKILSEQIKIPEGIECKASGNKIEFKKGDKNSFVEIKLRGGEILVQDGNLILGHKRANKKELKIIKSDIAHIKNVFKGLNDDFVYKLEICNVHFPMNVKVEGDKVLISNFLGEKITRVSKISPGVKVEVKNKEIIVSGSDIGKTGQTAANLEKASKVRVRDRRIFQDGIFITEKPRRSM